MTTASTAVARVPFRPPADPGDDDTTARTVAPASRVRGHKITRQKTLRWMPIANMEIFEGAQRPLNPQWVQKLIDTMDLEQLGNPTVNQRDGRVYVLDGRHRTEALRGIGYSDQSIECWVYEDLTDQEMAEIFLKLNTTLTVSTFAKFRIEVEAGRPEATAISKIVRGLGLRIQQADRPGAIRAVGTLRRVYRRGDPHGMVLERALRIIRDSFGDPGLSDTVIDGIGLVCARYGDRLEDTFAIKQLSQVHGNLNALVNRANKLREQTGVSPAQCVAAAAVEMINRQARGTRRLEPWFLQ